MIEEATFGVLHGMQLLERVTVTQSTKPMLFVQLSVDRLCEVRRQDQRNLVEINFFLIVNEVFPK